MISSVASDRVRTPASLKAASMSSILSSLCRFTSGTEALMSFNALSMFNSFCFTRYSLPRAWTTSYAKNLFCPGLVSLGFCMLQLGTDAGTIGTMVVMIGARSFRWPESKIRRKNISLCEPRRIRELFTLSLPLEPRCGLCVVCFRSLPHFTSLKFTCCAVYFRLNKMPSVVDNGFIADF